MTPIETYMKAFGSLARPNGPHWPTEALQKDPHKPLFVLALVDLFAQKKLTSNFVNTQEDLEELDKLFTEYWKKLISAEPTPNIALPFTQLSEDKPAFWKLEVFIGYSLDANQLKAMTDLKILKKVCEGAQMPENLLELLRDANARFALRETLLASHFSEQAVRQLR